MADIIVQLQLKTEFGEYFGKKHVLDEEVLEEFIKKARTYYQGGFELTLQDGSFVIFSPETIRKSILQINKKTIEEENDD